MFRGVGNTDTPIASPACGEMLIQYNSDTSKDYLICFYIIRDKREQGFYNNVRSRKFQEHCFSIFQGLALSLHPYFFTRSI